MWSILDIHMDRIVETKGHAWLPGWISKWWDTADEQGGVRPPFEAGTGMVRRPDVIIVNDPSKPPAQENIRQVVEIKFPPDRWSGEQKADYERIAGASGKLQSIGPEDCDCDKPEPDPPKIPVEQLGTAAGLAAMLYMLLTKRPPPTGVPAY